MCSLLTRALIFTVIENRCIRLSHSIKMYGLMQFLVLVHTFDERIKVICQGEEEGWNDRSTERTYSQYFSVKRSSHGTRFNLIETKTKGRHIHIYIHINIYMSIYIDMCHIYRISFLYIRIFHIVHT